MTTSYAKYLLSNIFLSFKDNFVFKLIMACWLYFVGIQTYIIGIGVLLLFDVITGVYASILKGESFTSKYLKKGLLEKLALYMILLVASFALEKMIMTVFAWNTFFIVFFVTVLISTYECISIFENILVINPNLTFLQSLIKISERLNSKAVEVVETKIDNADIPPQKPKDEKKPDESL